MKVATNLPTYDPFTKHTDKEHTHMSNHRVPPTGWGAKLSTAVAGAAPSRVDRKLFQAVFWFMVGGGFIRQHHALNDFGDSFWFGVGVVGVFFAIRALMVAHAIMVRDGEY